MIRNLLISFTLLISISFFGCTSNDAQTEFERQAYALPEGITTINTQQNITDVDEDDWRISPIYAGLVEVTPVFPNPLPYTDIATLDIYIKGTLLSSSIHLYFLDSRNAQSSPQPIQENDVTEFSNTIFYINPKEFGESPEFANGIHRLIVFDGSQRIITYGDILIE